MKLFKGHALITNKFIEILNTEYGMGITELNTDNYTGQCTSKSNMTLSAEAIRNVYKMFVR